MKKADLKVGSKVVMRRYICNYGVGTVKEILKTRIKVQFPDAGFVLGQSFDENMICTVDNTHIQFLDPWNYAKRKTTKKR